VTECIECSSTENIHQHHTNYERDETVPLCAGCHIAVHRNPDHELYPDDLENSYNGYILNPVTKKIIEPFFENPASCYNVSDISEETGVCRSAIYDRLDDLLEHNVLEETEFDKHYTLNSKSQASGALQTILQAVNEGDDK
jgi:hypothetical protein